MVIVADFQVVEPARIRGANWQFVADGHALGPVLAGKYIGSAYEDVQEFPDFVEVIGIGECPVVEGCGDDSVWYLVCRSGVGLGGDATCPDRQRRGPPDRSADAFRQASTFIRSPRENPSWMKLPSETAGNNCRVPGRQRPLNIPDSAGRAQLTYAPFFKGRVLCTI